MPRSVALRMSRPSPCFSMSTATGTWYSPKAFWPRLRSRSMRADTTGSPGRGEGQLVDDHAGELLPRHVHTLPEGGGREEHGVRRRPEGVEQLRLRRLALDEERVVHPPRDQRQPPRSCSRRR